MSHAQKKVPGRARTIATVLVLTAVMGVVAGNFRLTPGVMWVIFMPNVFLIYRLLVGKRRTPPPSGPSTTEHVLLEASNTGGRVVQSLLPLVGTVLGILGVTMLFRADGGVGVLSVTMTVAGALHIVLPLRTVIGWDVSHKGHAIRFENDPCSGERLLIDGQLVDQGGVGIHMELLGTIANGDGAGDVINVTSHAGLPTFYCRIVAVSAASARV